MDGVALTDKPTSWQLADAIVDGTAGTPEWVTRRFPDLDLEVKALRGPLRRPVNGRLLVVASSYHEQLAVCRALKAISPTHSIFQALWRACTVKLTPKPLVITAADSLQMGSLAWLIKANDAYEAEIEAHTLDLTKVEDSDARGYWKAWLIGLLMREQGADGAENEGFIYPDGHELQHEGGAHNGAHLDYSQAIADLVLRVARRISTGELVDLREVFCGWFPALADRIRAEYPDAVDLTAEAA